MFNSSHRMDPKLTQQAKKIILVDDNAIFRFIFETMIQNFNDFPVALLSFPSAADALHYLKEIRNNSIEYPDFLFVDINMPFMTGWEMMDVLKTGKDYKFISEIPVFMISSSTSKRDIEKQHDYPFIKGYVLKPTDAHTVYEIIKNSIS